MNIRFMIDALATACCWVACSEDEKYGTSVVNSIEMYVDGEQWTPGDTRTRPLFIYNEDGSSFVQYSSSFKFSLENKSYKVLCTQNDNLIPFPTNVNDIVISQDTLSKQSFIASLPVSYNAAKEDTLKLHMYTRTGILRLKGIDVKADKSYSTVRAVVTTPINGYKVSDGTYTEGEMTLTRDKATTTGGLSYQDDFVLFGTVANGKMVNVRIDYLDANNDVILSKEMDGAFPVIPDSTLTVMFHLNNADEPMIQDYTVSVTSAEWDEEAVNPDPPVLVPEGYTLVGKGDDINTVYKNLMNDASVEAVKIYLKAGETYTINGGLLENPAKPVYILGQEPFRDKGLATVKKNSLIIFTGNVGGVHFKNLKIQDTGRVFQFKGQHFDVDTISFVNCEFENLAGVLWYQNDPKADNVEIVRNLIIDNCRFYNIAANFFVPVNRSIVPVYNISIKNSTFHMKKTVMILGNLNRVPDNLNVTIENNTFVSAACADATMFNLNGASATQFNLSVKNNLFVGSDSGLGTLFVLDNVTNRNISGNYYTKGYVMKAWGLDDTETPVATSLTMDELFSNAVGGDLTIKDKSSEVYVNKIGDSYWCK